MIYIKTTYVFHKAAAQPTSSAHDDTSLVRLMLTDPSNWLDIFSYILDCMLVRSRLYDVMHCFDC